MTAKHQLSALLLCVVTIACSDGSPAAPEPDGVDGTTATLPMDSLVVTTQTGRRSLYAELGDTLQVWVQVNSVRDGDSRPLASEALRYEVIEGAASLVTAADTTDSAGRSTLRIHVGNEAGPIAVRVEAIRTGDQAQVQADGVRADRFGPVFDACGHLGLDSRIEAIPHTDGGYAPAVSPDGTRLAFEVSTDSTREIYLLDLASDALQRVTPSADVRFPSWSPDGSMIVFSDMERDPDMIAVVAAEGGATQRFPSMHGRIWWPRWSPSGEFILFSWSRPGRHFESWLQPVAGGAPLPLLAGDSPVGLLAQPAWSTDGQRIGHVAGSSVSVLDLQTGVSAEILWDREGGVEDFAWDSASGSIVYGSLRSSSRHLFLYRPVQDLWCSIPGTGELNASTPTWLVPERSLVFSGRTGGRRLYRIDLGN